MCRREHQQDFSKYYSYLVEFNWKPTKFVRSLACEVSNTSPIFYFSRIKPNIHAKSLLDICHGFAVAFFVVVNDDSLKSNPVCVIMNYCSHDRIIGHILSFLFT